MPSNRTMYLKYLQKNDRFQEATLEESNKKVNTEWNLCLVCGYLVDYQ